MFWGNNDSYLYPSFVYNAYVLRKRKEYNCEDQTKILPASLLNCGRTVSFLFPRGNWSNIGTTSYRRGSTFIFCARPRAVFTVCLAVCLLHSLGVQTHCASASSADGIHETSSCRIPVSSRCRGICRAWVAPDNLVYQAWYTYFAKPSFFCGFIYVSRCTLENEGNGCAFSKFGISNNSLEIKLNIQIIYSRVTVLIIIKTTTYYFKYLS